MNILNVFKDEVSSLVKGSGQDVSEKLIELATFFYKVDKRVSLEEQKYIEDLLETMDWQSSISIESFQRDCISKVNGIIDKSDDEISIYLSGLMYDLVNLGAADKAQQLAKEISDADGEVADDEIRHLDFVKSYS